MSLSKKTGILALASRSSGGIYQYTQSMIDALHLAGVKGLIVFAAAESYQTYDFEVCRVTVNPSRSLLSDVLRAVALGFGIRSARFLNRADRNEICRCDFLVSPVSSPCVFWSGLPYLVTLHDFQERYYPQYFSWRERVRRHLTNRALARASHSVICESEYVKSDVIRFTGADPSKVRVLSSPPRMAPVSRDEGMKRGLLPSSYIFYPAQFWPHKNHVTLIKAFAQIKLEFPDLKLLLTGDLASYESSILPQVMDLGMKDQVQCLGYVSDEELSRVYSFAAAVVIPTLFESISIPIFESFQRGIPVCCSGILALPEQLGDAGLLFDPHSPQDIAAKVIRILKDASLRETLVQRGKERLKPFTLAAYGKALEALLRESRTQG